MLARVYGLVKSRVKHEDLSKTVHLVSCIAMLMFPPNTERAEIYKMTYHICEKRTRRVIDNLFITKLRAHKKLQ